MIKNTESKHKTQVDAKKVVNTAIERIDSSISYIQKLQKSTRHSSTSSTMQ